MRFKLFLIIILPLFVIGCSGSELKDFKNVKPKLILEEYFAGETQAWGIFEDRFGKVRRQFRVGINGTWDGNILTLDEKFRYSDGEIDRRIWRISKNNIDSYVGSAPDIVGVAWGRVSGNALNWRYQMNLDVEGIKLLVTFDDWMFLQPGGVLINRATVTKLGVEIGTVTVFFKK